MDQSTARCFRICAEFRSENPIRWQCSRMSEPSITTASTIIQPTSQQWTVPQQPYSSSPYSKLGTVFLCLLVATASATTCPLSFVPRDHDVPVRLRSTDRRD